MKIVCLDLEGVLVPEVWLGVAERTGIDELRLTTRDVADYDELMRHRLDALARHDIRMPDIAQVVGSLQPLPGAGDFLAALRADYQVAVVSDTFYEFAGPLMAQLDRPFILCHRLEVAEDGRVVGYRLRQPDPKRASVQAFHSLRYRVLAAGDSYNDVAMLDEADAGIFFRAPERVLEDYPQYPLTTTYGELRAAIDDAAARLEGVRK